MPKKKTKIAELPASGETENNPALIVDLQDDETALWTGAMNGCCSVIVLWNADPQTGRYGNMRGQHGAGGPQALDWPRLFAGVPLDTGRIVMACNAEDFPDPADYPGKVKARLKVLHFAGPRTFSSEGSVLVDRTGTVTSLAPEEVKPAEYEVRVTKQERRRR